MLDLGVDLVEGLLDPLVLRQRSISILDRLRQRVMLCVLGRLDVHGWAQPLDLAWRRLVSAFPRQAKYALLDWVLERPPILQR